MYICIETTHKIPCHFYRNRKKKHCPNTKPYEIQRNLRAKTILRAKNDNGDFRFPEFKTDKNATTVKTVLYQQQNRQRDQ